MVQGMKRRMLSKSVVVILLLLYRPVFASIFYDPIKIVSYNILSPLHLKYGNYAALPDEVINWDKRKPRILQIIQNSAADIICLQEIDAKSYQYFEQQLLEYGYAGVYAEPIKANKDSVATFYQTSKFKLYSKHVHVFQGYNKSFQEINLESKEGVLLTVVNTKIQWDNENKSVEEHKGYQQLLSLGNTLHLERAKNSTIICGDFNFEPWQVQRVDFIKQYIDVHALSDLHTIQIDGKLKRIDYIFASKGFNVINLGTLIKKEYAENSPSIDNPSDHLPIFAELQ